MSFAIHRGCGYYGREIPSIEDKLKMRKPILLMLLLAISVTPSCALRVSKTMKSWTGHHYSELLGSWGPPEQVFDDGNGGRMLIWTQQRTFYTVPAQAVTQTNLRATIYDNMIWGQANSVTTYTPARISGYTAWRMFSIDSTGYIYSWRWKGL
jgi:hypothetical protein